MCGWYATPDTSHGDRVWIHWWNTNRVIQLQHAHMIHHIAQMTTPRYSLNVLNIQLICQPAQFQTDLARITMSTIGRFTEKNTEQHQ